MRACAAPTGKRFGAIPKRRTCSPRIGMETPAIGRSGLETGGCLVVVWSGHAGLTSARCVSPSAVTRPRRPRWRPAGRAGSRDAAPRWPRALRGARSSRRARTMQIECRRCPREDVARFPIGRGCCRMAGGTPGQALADRPRKRRVIANGSQFRLGGRGAGESAVPTVPAAAHAAEASLAPVGRRSARFA